MNDEEVKTDLVDCEDLEKHTVTLTVTGLDLKNIVNGLYANEMIMQQYEDVRVCDNCRQSNADLYKRLDKELNRLK
jgi:uncharacterized CHY-type Zn-finger protein